MKKPVLLLSTLFVLLIMVGCCSHSDADASPSLPPATAAPEETASSKLSTIPFCDEQLYAVAFLGYEEMDLAYYVEHYLDSSDLPIHYISPGEFYLIIPRSPNMHLLLYRNSLETSEQILIYEDTSSQPFIIQCNISDIFPDATICFADHSGTIEFSPYISLKDGSVQVGEYGLDLTQIAQ